MTLAPIVRGTFIDRFGHGVLVEPAADPADVVAEVDARADEGAAAALKPLLCDLRTPVVLQINGERYRVERSPGSGRVAVVTGGAQGIGADLVEGLSAQGWAVFVADLNVAKASALARTLRGRAWAVEVDVADEASVAELFTAVEAAVGGVDLVVSNAGIVRAGSVLEQTPADFRLTTEVNYAGFFHVAQHAARLMRRQHLAAPGWWSDIVQINSKSGLAGSNRNAAYAGSKFGGIGLVQSFALELVEHGIKVNAICPGNYFDGPLWSDPEGLFAQYLRSGKVPGAETIADVRAFYEAKVPMGRGVESGDVLRCLTYIVEQRYETGQALPVTGGQAMLH